MTKSFKKTTLGLSTAVLAIAAPIATVVSCGSKDGDSSIIDASSIKGRIDSAKVSADYKNAPITLVTDTGKVTDLSFNQSGYEIAKIFAKDAGVKINKIEPSATSQIGPSYKTAFDNGTKTFVLPGFHHDTPAKTDLPIEAHAVIIDGHVPSADNPRTKNIAGLQYKVEQAAMQAGYAAGEYLNAIGDTDPKIGTFVGGMFDGVANFSLGYLLGAAQYNKDHEEEIKAGTIHPVKYATETFTATTSFKPGEGLQKAKQLLSAGADIIMPVAGPQTADVIKAINDTKSKNKLVIGVDVDQSKSYDKSADKFFSSVEKNIGQSTYDALRDLYTNGGKKYFGKNTRLGIKDNWTGLADPTVKNHAAEAKTAIKNARTKFGSSFEFPTLSGNYTETMTAWQKAKPAGQQITDILSNNGGLTLTIQDIYGLF